MYKQRGSPRFCIRMPKPINDALRQMAADRNTTPSDIVRDLTITELKRTGYLQESREVKTD